MHDARLHVGICNVLLPVSGCSLGRAVQRIMHGICKTSPARASPTITSPAQPRPPQPKPDQPDPAQHVPSQHAVPYTLGVRYACAAHATQHEHGTGVMAANSPFPGLVTPLPNFANCCFWYPGKSWSCCQIKFCQRIQTHFFKKKGHLPNIFFANICELYGITVGAISIGKTM